MTSYSANQEDIPVLTNNKNDSNTNKTITGNNKSSEQLSQNDVVLDIPEGDDSSDEEEKVSETFPQQEFENFIVWLNTHKKNRFA